MKAVVIAAGEAERLRPYTEIIPKIMFPVGGKPIGRRIVEKLFDYEFKNIIFCVSKHWSNYIKDYFGHGERFGVDIQYSESDKPLGSAGEVKNAENLIDDDFLVYYGDIITEINLWHINAMHLSYKGEPKYMGTLGVQRGLDTEVGIIDVKDENIKSFEEKRSLPCYSWSAVALLKKEILNRVSSEDNDFGTNIFPKLIRDGYILKAYENRTKWRDVGNLRSYRIANEEYSHENS